MRFRRRTKLFPGVYLNFSSSGISTTIGPRGASLNIGRKGTFLNTGIPGTGFSERRKVSEPTGRSSSTPTPVHAIPPEEIGAIKSEPVEGTTSEGLEQLRQTLVECYEERQEINRALAQEQASLQLAGIVRVVACTLLFGFVIKWFKENVERRKDAVEHLRTGLAECVVPIDMEIPPQMEAAYGRLHTAFTTMASCERVWDITSAIGVDRRVTRSAASTTVTRRVVKFAAASIDVIRTERNAMHLANANGGDLYLFPAFIAMVSGQKKFGLIDLRELQFSYHGQQFIESERVPSDANVVGHTWAKVNKNGSPDKRFKDNYQIPICMYGEIGLCSNTGLNEAYQLSNEQKTEAFAIAMHAYQKLMAT